MAVEPSVVEANEVLARFVVEQVTDLGLTYDDIQEMGGPSPATMTKIVKGDGYRMSLETARKLDAGLGFVPGTARMISTGLIDLDRVEERRKAEVVRRSRDDDDVMLDLPDEALEGLSKVERDEVYATARAAALKRAREIRAGGQVGLFTVD